MFLSTILSTGIETSKNVLTNEIPSFSIENGILSADTEVPVIIEQEDFTIILDPTGNITEQKVGEEGNAFALLTDKFVVSAGGRIDTYPYTMLEGIYISKDEVSNFIDILDGVKGIIIPVMSFFIFLFLALQISLKFLF